MKSHYKKIKNSILYKIKYIKSDVNGAAIISSDSKLQDGVRIEALSAVVSSNLGRGTVVKKNCCAKYVRTGNNVCLYENGFFSELEIDSYSYVANNAIIGMTKIGRFCSIGPYLICGYGEHPVDLVSTSPVFYSTSKQCGVSFSEKNFFEEHKQIAIGHDVWIGARVFIRDGVRVGNGAIIATGAVVVKDVPDYAIVGGVPARIIRYRFPQEIIQELLAIAWWDWPEEKLRTAQGLFVRDDIYPFLEWARKTHVED